MLRILCVEPTYSRPIFIDGAFLLPTILCSICDYPYRAFLLSTIGRDAMCELSNAEVYNRYHQDGISQTAKDYWLNFLKKRANRGGKDSKGAQVQIDKIEFYKQLRAHSLRVKQPTHNRQIEGSKPSGPTILN